MPCDFSARLDRHFASLTDPRRGEVTYPLINIVAIALCATIAGADDFVAIADWARQKQGWLAEFLDLSSGIPSHDRFNAIFRALKPEQFERRLVAWITELHKVIVGQVVPIDGKTMRQSSDKATGKSALHMVSARATTNKIGLGQVAVAEESNEITAIPELLGLPEIAGAVVTIDAMGCQTEIAEEILERKADYVLAVKANQPTPHEDEGVVDFFLDQMGDDFARVKVSRHETKEKGHGRIEHRTYSVCDVPEDLPDASRWAGLKRIGVAISDTVRSGKPCDDVRYYIPSRKMSARGFGAAVRGHGSIENSLHWQLDMSFGEDRSRVRRDHADANMAASRRLALGLLKNEASKKVGIKNERLVAAWNIDYLRQVLFGA
jgi:predicted transposase YbfD/YdcC